MMKDVLIKIKGTQGLGDQNEVIELTTVGKIGVRGENILVSYEEPDTVGEKGVKTQLHYKAPNTVILKRTGPLNSKLVICKGVRNNCSYSTAVGEMMLGIYGENIESTLTENGGKLIMSYTLDSNLRLVSRNQVEITVREV
ncbi:MAG: DUF1934 domain-containing protein [Ruminococcaceae bacterium]|nr:DUF1934 domain-containing protein [Oscillospiraceae bacterium]